MPKQKSNGWTPTNHVYFFGGITGRCCLCNLHERDHLYVPED